MQSAFRSLQAPILPLYPAADIPSKVFRHGAPLHIVHTEASLGWGGQEIRVLNESAGLMARGHHVTLLCAPEATIFEKAPRWGVPAVPLPLKRKNLGSLLAVRQWLHEHRPDVVNTHSSTDSWLVALANALPGTGIPVIRTRHISTPVKADPTSHWLYGKAAYRVVTTGESIRHDLLERLGLASERIVSIPTGVDLDRFQRAHALDRHTVRSLLRIPEGTKVIGIVATLRSWKGHDYLLDALPAVIAAVPDVHLLVVGDGPRREHLEQRIRAFPWQERISLLGQRNDVPDLLAAMDLFVLPSFANEGVPQAIMQAMAMGLGVVSTPVGAIGELVQHGVTGILVPPRDAESLAHEIIRLLRNPFLLHRLGLAGKRKVMQQFSQEAMLDDMEAVFRLAAATGPSRQYKTVTKLSRSAGSSLAGKSR